MIVTCMPYEYVQELRRMKRTTGQYYVYLLVWIEVYSYDSSIEVDRHLSIEVIRTASVSMMYDEFDDSVFVYKIQYKIYRS
jgi:hypothetical protein